MDPKRLPITVMLALASMGVQADEMYESMCKLARDDVFQYVYAMATTENDFAAKRKLREYREHADQDMLRQAPDEITRLRAESTAKTAHQYADTWLDIKAQRVELALFEYRSRRDLDVDFKAARQLADDVAASIHTDCLKAVEANGTALTKPKPTESSETPTVPADSPTPAHR